MQSVSILSLEYSDIPSPDTWPFMSDSVLSKIAHHLQIAGVAAVTLRDFDRGYMLFAAAVEIRAEVMRRFATPDDGHIVFHNVLVYECHHLLAYMNDPCKRRYQFLSGDLLGNAMDKGIYVNRSFFPPKWTYKGYAVQNPHSRRSKAVRYQLRTAAQ
jgi:hypothetical protein